MKHAFYARNKPRNFCNLQAYDDLEHFETPFVVKLYRFNTLALTQDVFTFVHPNRDAIVDNTRCVPLLPRERLRRAGLGIVQPLFRPHGALQSRWRMPNWAETVDAENETSRV